MPKLTVAFVRSAREPGRYYDAPHGHGLFLIVDPTGAKRWGQRLSVAGKRRELGVGPTWAVTLAEAREQALANHKLARSGRDPVADKRKAAAVPTFREAAAAVIALYAKGWREGRSPRQWENSFRDYVFPHIGDRSVSDITAADVLAVMLHNDFWNAKRETARRTKQRVGAVMRWAIAEGHRADDPMPAVDAALPKNGHQVTHKRALPHGEVARAIATVRASGAGETAKLAFELIVLTACRPGEVRLATWNEIDLEAATWTIDAGRTKTGREHRVPLSARALAVLRAAREYADGSGLAFPGTRPGRPLSDATLSKLLRENGIEAVPHGFRSSFRSWCADNGIDREVAEACLAHVVKGVEGAYQRSTMLDRRREVMTKWANYLAVI